MEYPLTKTSPWEHQKKFWKFFTGNNNTKKPLIAAYAAHEMGNGKTKIAIDCANGIDAKLVIVICPKKVIGVWPGQFKKHSYHEYKMLPLIKGTTVQKSVQVKNFVKECQNFDLRGVVIVNYDTYWRPPLGTVYVKNRVKDPGVLASVQWDLMICDEAHRLKTAAGSASWGAKRLAQSSKRRLWLSGTPMPHSPLDLYAQFRSLAPWVFGTRAKLFKDTYCVMGGFNAKQVVAFKNLDQLNKKFYSIAQFVATEDAHDLPPKQDIEIKFDLGPKAKKLYHELDTELISEISNKEISADNVLVKIIRLAQITGGFVKLDDGSEKVIDNNKIETTVEILDGLPETEPVVIFVLFQNELQRLREAITKKFKARKIGELSGRQGVKDPSDFVDGIWNATDTNTLLVQIQTGSEGIDLTAARYCFFVSSGHSLGLQRQARRRLWRPGQDRKVFYYYILAKNTIDEKIMAAKKAKKKVIDVVIEGVTGKKTISSVRNSAIKKTVAK